MFLQTLLIDSQSDACLREDDQINKRRITLTRSFTGLLNQYKSYITLYRGLVGSGLCANLWFMEDAATAEISRSSLWQLVKHNVGLILDLPQKTHLKNC